MYRMIIDVNDDNCLKRVNSIMPTGVNMVSKGVYETEEKFDFWIVMSTLFGKQWFADSLLDWKWYKDGELIEDLCEYAR